MILSLKHNFLRNKKRIPRPDSAAEKNYFNIIKEILYELAPYCNIIVIGNEPFLEVMKEDCEFDFELGDFPIVVFYQRLTELVYQYLKDNPQLGNPDLYLGAFNRLDLPENQQKKPIQKLLEFSQGDERIKGVDIHIHVSEFSQFAEQLEFTRSLVQKPLLVTEFSLVWRYKEHNSEILGVNEAGRQFCKKYNYDTNMKFYEYINLISVKRVLREEWVDFLKTRDWFIPSFIKDTYNCFNKYNVKIATYAFKTPYSGPVSFSADYTPWIINQLYISQLAYTENGEVATNYGFFNDFVEINSSKLNV